MFPSLSLLKLAGIGVAALALLFGGWQARGHWDAGDIEKMKRETAEQVAAAAKAAADAEQAHAAASDAQVAQMIQAAQQRVDAIDALRKDVLRAPKSYDCARSPAMRVVLDSLRRQRAAAASPSAVAQKPGSPTDLQAGTRPAGQ